MILDYCPVPPSANRIYATDWRTKRRFPSQEYKEYEKRFRSWSLKRIKDVIDFKNENAYELLDPFKCVQLDILFHFQHQTLFTKKPMKRKKMDSHNLLKVLIDQLSVILGIDDSRIVLGSVKMAVVQENQGQWCSVKFSLDRIQESSKAMSLF